MIRTRFAPSPTGHHLIIPSERIVSKIYIIRNKKVMLDRDLAELYQVTTGALNQAVKRNARRFPPDFMFQLDKGELQSLISQFVISKRGRGGVTKLPLAFSEQGVAMLASVLKSNRAIDVNIQIVREKSGDPIMAEALIKYSNMRFGQPREEVEAELRSRYTSSS